MKKIMIVLMMLTALNHQLFSQDLTTLITMHGGFGNAKSKEAKLSGGFGLDFDLTLTEKVHFNVMPTLNFRSFSGLVEERPKYIDIPVCFEFSLDENTDHLFVGIGGYYGFAIGGKYRNILTTTGNTDWQKMSFGEDIDDTRSKTDYGLLLNVGGYFEGFNNVFKAGIQYMYGLKNVVPEARHNDTILNNAKLRYITLFIEFSVFNK